MRLFRAHARLLLRVTSLTLVPAAIVCRVCFTGQPLSPIVLFGALVFSVVLGSIIDMLFLYRSYEPLRTVDSLPGDQMYAQNPNLSKAVVLLQNLSLSAFYRAVLIRALPSTTFCCLLLSALSPEPVSGRALASFIVLNVCLVPVFPGIFEMLALRPMIQEFYPELLSYQVTLLEEWKNKRWNVGFGVRLAILVFMLGVVPLCVLAFNPFLLSSGGAVIIALTSLVVAVAAGVLLQSDVRKSRDILLGAMHHLERNKPGRSVNIPSADEFSQLAAGMTSMIAGMKEQSFMRDSFGAR